MGKKYKRIALKFNINPVPAARPRVSRWSTYYPKKYTQFKKDMLALTSELDVTPIENLVAMGMVFNVKMPTAWTKKKKLEQSRLEMTGLPKIIRTTEKMIRLRM